MNFRLRIWRQEAHDAPGRFETYEVHDIAPDESFLEMMDELNDRLILEGVRPIAFDHDCREGICGTCSMTIDGHGTAASGALAVSLADFAGRIPASAGPASAAR